MKYGLRSVSMDDVARELGISKKTLYQHVENKQDLVEKVLIFDRVEDCHLVKELHTSATNAIEMVVKLSKFVINSMKDINPSLLYDLAKYFPELQRQQFDLKKQVIEQTIIANIEQGRKEGFYRNNFDKKLSAFMYSNTVFSLFLEITQSNEPFPFPMSDMIAYHFEQHLRNICNPKGIEEFERLQQLDN